jgi:hypothetical protein
MQHGACNYTVTAGTCPNIQSYYYVHDDTFPRVVDIYDTGTISTRIVEILNHWNTGELIIQ